jgi:hypothetical protein
MTLADVVPLYYLQLDGKCCRSCEYGDVIWHNGLRKKANGFSGCIEKPIRSEAFKAGISDVRPGRPRGKGRNACAKV